jgi:hypothetical protein
MYLYKKTFPLGKGMTFSDYIKALDEAAFTPFVLLINKIPSTQNYHIEITTAMLVALYGPHPFSGFLFNECVIEYTEGQREFTLNASISLSNILLTIFYGLMALFIIGLAIWSAMTVGISTRGFFILMIVSAVILMPVRLAYLREIRMLKAIGSITMEQLSNDQ